MTEQKIISDLIKVVREIPAPEEGDICLFGCGRMELVEEEVISLEDASSYTKYFFQHRSCWYAELQKLLKEWDELEKSSN